MSKDTCVMVASRLAWTCCLALLPSAAHRSSNFAGWPLACLCTGDVFDRPDLGSQH